jgi:hypothetical protein
MMLPRDVFMKMAAIVNTEYPADGTRNGANGSADYCTDGASSLFALSGTFLRTAYRTLCSSC